jgi:hypothetical protein
VPVGVDKAWVEGERVGWGDVVVVADWGVGFDLGGEGIPDGGYFGGGKEVGDVDDTLFGAVFMKVGGGGTAVRVLGNVEVIEVVAVVKTCWREEGLVWVGWGYKMFWENKTLSSCYYRRVIEARELVSQRR